MSRALVGFGGLIISVSGCISSSAHNHTKSLTYSGKKGDSSSVDPPITDASSDSGPAPANVPAHVSGKPTGLLMVDPQVVREQPHLGPFLGQVAITTLENQYIFSGPDDEWVSQDRSGGLKFLTAVFSAVQREHSLSSAALELDCPGSCPHGLVLRLSGPILRGSPASGATYQVLGSVRPEKKIGEVEFSDHQIHRIADLEFTPIGFDGLEVVVTPQTNIWGAFPRIRVAGSDSRHFVAQEQDLIETGESRKIAYAQTSVSGASQTGCLLTAQGNSELGVDGSELMFRPTDSSSKFSGRIFCGENGQIEGFNRVLLRLLGSGNESLDRRFSEAISYGAGDRSEATAVLTNQSGDPLLKVALSAVPRLMLSDEESHASHKKLRHLTLVVHEGAESEILSRLQTTVTKLVSLRRLQTFVVDFNHRPGVGATDPKVTGDDSSNVMAPDVLVISATGSESKLRNLQMRYADGTTRFVGQVFALSDAGAVLTVEQWPLPLRLVPGNYRALFFKRELGLICDVPFTVGGAAVNQGAASVACRESNLATNGIRKISRIDNRSGSEAQVVSVMNKRLGISFLVEPPPDRLLTQILRGLGSPSVIRVDPSRRKIPNGGNRILIPCGTGTRLLQNIRATPLAFSAVRLRIPVHGCPSDRDVFYGWTLLEKALNLGLRAEASVMPTTGGQSQVLDLIYPFVMESPEPQANMASSDVGGPLLGRSGFFISLTNAGTGRSGLVARIQKKSFVPAKPNRDFSRLRIRVIAGSKLVRELPIERRSYDLHDDFHELKIPIGTQFPSRSVRVQLVGDLDETIADALSLSRFVVLAESQIYNLK